MPGLTTLPNIDGRAGDDRGPEQRRGTVRRLGPDDARRVPARGRPAASGSRTSRGRATRPGCRCGCPTCGASGPPSTIPTLRSSLHGLDIAQGPEAMLRAAHEASGFVIRRIIERSGCGAKRIVATGGGSRSLPWMQAVADATGLPVDTVAVSEGAALGAAFLARMAAGRETSFDAAHAWARAGRRIDPEPVGPPLPTDGSSSS